MRCLGYDKGEFTNYHPVVYGPTHYFPDFWSLKNTFLWIRLIASCNTIFSIQIVNEKKWQNTSFPKLLLPCNRNLEKSKFISKHCTQTPLSLKLIFKHPHPNPFPISIQLAMMKSIPAHHAAQRTHDQYTMASKITPTTWLEPINIKTPMNCQLNKSKGHFCHFHVNVDEKYNVAI